MKYFSVDYRSTPSGMGQIVDSSKPELIKNHYGKDVYNMTLVTYSGNGPEMDPSYLRTAFFRSQKAEQEGWSGPIMEYLIEFLEKEGVTHVHDIELFYEQDGSDDRGYFPLDRWAEIMMSFQ